MAESNEAPPLDEARLTEIRQALSETRADMDAWYQAHPNPQWRREHPFDYDSIVANTYTYITIPALLAEVDRQRALHNEAWDLIDRLSEDLADHEPIAHDWLLDEANAWRAKYPKTL